MFCAVVLKIYHDLRGISPSDYLWLSSFLIILHQFSDGRKYLAPVDVSLHIWIPLLWNALWLVLWILALGQVPMALEVGFPCLSLWVPPIVGAPLTCMGGVAYRLACRT